MPLTGTKDPPTVTPEGKRLEPLIDGVIVRPAVVQQDERGEICELYDPAWGVVPDPLVYVYAASIRPGRVKGWVYHKAQVDRLFALLGTLKIVLYDLRDESATRGMINEIFLGERARGLVVIPAMVAHAVQNVGDKEATFINMPTRPYRHADPDKIPAFASRNPVFVRQGQRLVSGAIPRFIRTEHRRMQGEHAVIGRIEAAFRHQRMSATREALNREGARLAVDRHADGPWRRSLGGEAERYPGEPVMRVGQENLRARVGTGPSERRGTFLESMPIQSSRLARLGDQCTPGQPRQRRSRKAFVCPVGGIKAPCSNCEKSG